MTRIFTFIVISIAFSIGGHAQNWENDDPHSDHNRSPNDPWNQPNQGWDQNNGDRNNPYQDPNYYPPSYRGCTPPPPPCRRNIVIVTPPPSYGAPVFIATMQSPYYRPYRYNPYRSFGHGYGWGGRRWRGR